MTQKTKDRATWTPLKNHKTCFPGYLFLIVIFVYQFKFTKCYLWSRNWLPSLSTWVHPQFFSGVHVARSFVFCVMFYRSFFVLFFFCILVLFWQRVIFCFFIVFLNCSDSVLYFVFLLYFWTVLTACYILFFYCITIEKQNITHR
jgi:hypothetical protein